MENIADKQKIALPESGSRTETVGRAVNGQAVTGLHVVWAFGLKDRDSFSIAAIKGSLIICLSAGSRSRCA